jgi:hypothetical protein
MKVDRRGSLAKGLVLAAALLPLACGTPAQDCRATLTCEDTPENEIARVESARPCQPGQAGCAACQADSDCAPGTPSCSRDPSAIDFGRCVECISDEECNNPVEASCNQDQETPGFHRCQPCTGNAECQAQSFRLSSGASTCRPADGRCVECLAAAECGSFERSACDSSGSCTPCADEIHCSHIAGRTLCRVAQPNSPALCVECLSDSDCTSPSRARCDTSSNTCVPCNADTQCTGKISQTALPACALFGPRRGQCVQCTGLNASACAGSVCNSALNTCPQNLRENQPGTAARCDPCLSDRHCAFNASCVEQVRAGAAIGFVCLPTFSSSAGCSETAPHDLSIFATSIDGANVQLCDLRDTSSCPAFLLYGTECAGADAECGAPGINDAACVPNVNSGTGFTCSNRCAVSRDCPTGTACNTSTNLCDLPP